MSTDESILYNKDIEVGDTIETDHVPPAVIEDDTRLAYAFEVVEVLPNKVDLGRQARLKPNQCIILVNVASPESSRKHVSVIAKRLGTVQKISRPEKKND